MSGGLFGSATLDVAIGLVFVYLMLALICTTINEWIAGAFKRRPKQLRQGILQLLDGQPYEGASFIEAFDRHPLIRGLARDGRPSYLPARVFSSAVLDLVLKKQPADGKESDFGSRLSELEDGSLKRVLLALSRNAGAGLDEIEKRIEGWYEDAMDRVSGWYKRETQIWTILVAVGLTVAANADTLKVVRHLWSDPALRAQVVERAKAQANEKPPSLSVDYKDPNDPMKPTVTRFDASRVQQADRDLLSQLVGWGEEERTRTKSTDWLLRVLGWLLTAVAVSLGAPFWFDVLNKFMNVRSAGKSPDEAAKKPEKRKLPPADKTV